MSIESFKDRTNEIGLLHNLYFKEKKVIDDSKIKDSVREVFSDKEINEFDIKETSMENLGKCIVDVNWDYSEDKKICKTITIKSVGEGRLVVSNRQGDIRINKKEWGKRNMKKTINKALEHPILRSRNSFVDACH